MKYARKRDACERAIIAALKALGCSVTQLDGSGVPDLLVGYRDVDGEMPQRIVLLECKDAVPGKKAHRRNDGPMSELTPAQVKFWKAWTGPAIHIVHNAEEAKDAVFPERRKVAA